MCTHLSPNCVIMFPFYFIDCSSNRPRPLISKETESTLCLFCSGVNFTKVLARPILLPRSFVKSINHKGHTETNDEQISSS